MRKLSGSNVTEYISGIEYDGSTITFIQTEEGRVISPTTTPDYEYTLSDHLGDSRVNYDSSHGASSPTQSDDYYPFGLIATQGTTASPQNNYLYNKKELQAELTQYDYGARFYDPVIGRWTSPDPMAEISRRFSPYNYGDDNSIRNIDPDGMVTTDAQGTHSNSSEEAQAMFRELQNSQGGSSDPKKKQENEQNKKQEDQKTSDEQQQRYNESAKRHPKKTKVEKHHIDPQYLGGDKKGKTVAIPGGYHQDITNEFRKEWGYGTGKKPSPEQLEGIKKKVYGKFPLPQTYITPAPVIAPVPPPSITIPEGMTMPVGLKFEFVWF